MLFYSIYLVLAAVIMPTEVSAQQGVQHLALETNLGVSSFSGDLSADHAAPTYGLTVTVGQAHWGTSAIAKTLGGLGSMWNLSLTSISGKAKKNTSFPFNQSQRFNALATSISPTLCALTEAPLQVCLGIGWEEFDISQASDNEQIYGTTLWSLAAGRLLAEDLHVGVKLNYRTVTQTVLRAKSSFAALSVLLSIGWQFRT